jgi:sulfide:quinone oxidoreductase
MRELVLAEITDIRKQYSVVIVGGGAGGTSVAARLKKLDPDSEVFQLVVASTNKI